MQHKILCVPSIATSTSQILTRKKMNNIIFHFLLFVDYAMMPSKLHSLQAHVFGVVV